MSDCAAHQGDTDESSIYYYLFAKQGCKCYYSNKVWIFFYVSVVAIIFYLLLFFFLNFFVGIGLLMQRFFQREVKIYPN